MVILGGMVKMENEPENMEDDFLDDLIQGQEEEKIRTIDERIEAVDGEMVKLEGSDEFVHYSTVPGLSFHNNEMHVPRKGIAEEYTSRSQRVVGDSIALKELREIKGIPLEEEAKEVALGEFRSVPYKIGPRVIKRFDEYNIRTFKRVFFANNETQYLRVTGQLKDLLEKKFSQFILEEEQRKWESYLRTGPSAKNAVALLRKRGIKTGETFSGKVTLQRLLDFDFRQTEGEPEALEKEQRKWGDYLEKLAQKTDLNPSEEELDEAASYLRAKGVDTGKALLVGKANLDDLSAFKFTEIKEEEVGYVIDALKELKETTRRYVRYSQEFLYLVKRMQRAGLQDGFGAAFGRTKELCEATVRDEKRHNLLIEQVALSEQRIGRVASAIYEDEESFAKEFGKSYDEMKAAVEGQETPIQKLMKDPLYADRFESIDDAISEEEQRIERGEGVRTSTFFQIGYKLKELEDEEVVGKQRFKVEDNISLRRELFAYALIYAKNVKNYLGDK